MQVPFFISLLIAVSLFHLTYSQQGGFPSFSRAKATKSSAKSKSALPLGSLIDATSPVPGQQQRYTKATKSSAKSESALPLESVIDATTTAPSLSTGERSPIPSRIPNPTNQPVSPSLAPTASPRSSSPIPNLTKKPVAHSLAPTDSPSGSPPIPNPTKKPDSPSLAPTAMPSPTSKPILSTSSAPNASPTASPTIPNPTKKPVAHSLAPTDSPSGSPPIPNPTKKPDSPWLAPTMPSPTSKPILSTSSAPNASPTASPTIPNPTKKPVAHSLAPTDSPSGSPPIPNPTKKPDSPSLAPTIPSPTNKSILSTSLAPNASPTASPTISNPTNKPVAPLLTPTASPSETPPIPNPTSKPILSPSLAPTASPSAMPPIPNPMSKPVLSPLFAPTASPSASPQIPNPTSKPVSLPSLAPTDSHSLSPISLLTDQPSLSPIAAAEESCHLTTSVDCRLEDGQPCSSLSSIPADDLICTTRPSELEWLYRASGCENSSTSQKFECTDHNGGPGSAFMVHVAISSATTKEQYFAGSVFQGTGSFPVQRILVQNSINTVLDMKIDVLIRRDSKDGEILQKMSFSIACDGNNKLMLGDLFGALELNSFHGEGAEAGPAYASVTWKYSAQNLGIAESSLEAIMMDTNGDQMTATQELILSLGPGPGHSYTLFVRETISLVQAAVFSGELIIVEDNGSSSKCMSMANYSFSI